MKSFYDISDEYRAEISALQREKGLQKYPEPFNPASWTDDELANHAMMEFHDGQEYVAGLRQRMRELRVEIREYDDLVPVLHHRIMELEHLLLEAAKKLAKFKN
jgi:hypothetical protein